MAWEFSHEKDNSTFKINHNALEWIKIRGKKVNGTDMDDEWGSVNKNELDQRNVKDRMANLIFFHLGQPAFTSHFI